jgi:Flp pilus assembly protein TadG
MKTLAPILRLWRARSGAAAVELALVMPAFITMMVGGVYIGQMLFAANSMHYAVEVAARCAAVKTTVCTDSTSTTNYASNHYAGPVTPSFSYSATGCGHTVSATANYSVNYGLGAVTVPLSASSCYP